MRTVYADALYYFAALVPRDQLHRESLLVGATLRGVRIVTCEPVLVEVLAHVSGLGPTARARAVAFVDLLRGDHPTTAVIPQTPELFEDGLTLYRNRLDKGYSLTDACR